MNWTRPGDLRAQMQKLWDRGDLLAAAVTLEPLFPKRMLLKVPTSAEMSDRFDEVRSWITMLRKMPYCRVEMREFNHRLFGANAVPHELWVDSAADAVALLGKQRIYARFSGMIEVTRACEPRLLAWLAKRPLRAVELFDEWSRLLEIVAWFEKHPRPGVYLRQVDIPGVHSKFIEAQRGILSELLDMILPPEAIDFKVSGVSRFAKRYGLRDKPARVRFRMLDSDHAPLPLSAWQDITLDAESFARLDPGVSRVFMTENEINFLAFPKAADSMVIFGGGYGFEMLNDILWLEHRSIYYWGDIDSHGFAILDQLRSRFSHVESFLMDRGTLLAFEAHWGTELKQTLRDLPRLNQEERALYNDLRDNKICRNLRLEQEMIAYGWVESAISALSCG